MSERWRDKKSEPGFVFHPWMGTVDELEDIIAAKDAEIARLREALKEIVDADQVEMALDPEWPSRIARAALNGNDAQARSE